MLLQVLVWDVLHNLHKDYVLLTKHRISFVTVAYVWDVLHNLHKDYVLLTKHRISFVTVAYFLSRVAGLVYAVGRALLLTTQVDDCRRLELANMSFLTICLCLDTLLFYVRVCAVYCNDTRIVVFFGLCWLVVVSTAALVPLIFADSVMHILPTKYCVELLYSRSRSLKPTSLAVMVYDVFVFFATSYRFYQLYSAEGTSIPKGLKIAFFGASMPAFSKAMLHQSQVYYLIIALWKNGSLVCWLIFGAKQQLFVLMHLAPATVVLSNILTCRVFRNTKLGLVSEPPRLETLRISTVSNNNYDIRSFSNSALQAFSNRRFSIRLRLKMSLSFNALLPLIFGLNPGDSLRVNFSIYVHVGALSVMIWDGIHNLKGDYQLIVSGTSKIRMVIFFVSRSFTLAYALGRSLYITLPTTTCGPLQSALTASYIILACTTTLLAYLHLSSLFSNHPIILTTFGVSWATVVGASMLIVPGVKDNIFFAYCSEAVENEYTAAAFITTTIFHALLSSVVLFAALKATSKAKKGREGVQSTIQESYWAAIDQRSRIPKLAREITADMHCCYFTALLASLVQTIWFFASAHTSASSPRTDPFRLTMMVFYAVVANVTVCRVYRTSTLDSVSVQSAACGAPSTRSGFGAGMMRMASGNQLGMGTKEREGTITETEAERDSAVDLQIVTRKKDVEKVGGYQSDFEDDGKGGNITAVQKSAGEVFTVRMV
ncbi:unnamed protein product [Cyclocybe aegerita]|uniref:Uncharacterized protein n=1 Tax=Cyclocybe aegerita TaxID=1973307 RepID=A0A8S0VYK4_CYCAE|nr:unnamed protein product [Cyclocybe aegerita]